MLHALLIGINEYAHAKIPPLQYARADVELVTNYLEGVKDTKIARLEDAEATRANIANAIARIMATVRIGDRVMFYFSGHGTMNSPNPQADVKAYLAPHDADPSNIVATSYELHVMFPDLLHPLYERGARLLVVVDACFKSFGDPTSRAFASESARTGQHLNIEAETLPPYQRATFDRSSILIAAAQINEVAYEDRDLGHGIFTYHLIQTATSLAQTGPVSASALAESVHESTVSRQRPTFTAWNAVGAKFPSVHGP
jgi:uncharacterized caspase-like protein